MYLTNTLRNKSSHLLLRIKLHEQLDTVTDETMFLTFVRAGRPVSPL